MRELAVLLLLAHKTGVHELQDERAARDNAGAAGEEVTPDEALEHAALAARLLADDDNLRQVQRIRLGHSEHVLQLVDDGDELLHGKTGAGAREAASEVNGSPHIPAHIVAALSRALTRSYSLVIVLFAGDEAVLL